MPDMEVPVGTAMESFGLSGDSWPALSSHEAFITGRFLWSRLSSGLGRWRTMVWPDTLETAWGVEETSVLDGGKGGIGGTYDIVWEAGRNANAPFQPIVQEVDADGFSVLRTANAPDASLIATGVGGDESVIWYCNDEDLYELNVADFSVVQFVASVGGDQDGIGGDSNVVWSGVTVAGVGPLEERSSVDLSLVRSSAPVVGAFGIGGNISELWGTSSATARQSITEFSVADFSIIKVLDILKAPVGYTGVGIGG